MSMLTKINTYDRPFQDAFVYVDLAAVEVVYPACPELPEGSAVLLVRGGKVEPKEGDTEYWAKRVNMAKQQDYERAGMERGR